MLREIASGLGEYFFGNKTDNALKQHIQFVEEFHIQDKYRKEIYVKELEGHVKTNKRIKIASNLTLLGSAFCYAFSDDKEIPIIAAFLGESIRIFTIGLCSHEKRLVKTLHKLERNNPLLDIKMQSTYDEDSLQEYERDEDWWKKQ